ncbi:unnamed protein product [Rhodiola kirilowii]
MSSSLTFSSLLLLLLTSTTLVQVEALPPTPNNSSLFTYTGLHGIFAAPAPKSFKASKVSATEFPSLTGHDVSLTVLQFPPGGLNPPHVNVRASGLFIVLKGRVEVGFVDLGDKLYTQILEAGDVFVFPKGLVHYQYNVDKRKAATALAAFGSTGAGTYTIPSTIFGSGIRDEILAMSFNIDVDSIRKLKDGIE